MPAPDLNTTNSAIPAPAGAGQVLPVQSANNIPTAMSADALPLRDIHLPEPVSWWPPAPGWWLLLATVLVLVAIYIVIKKIRYSRRLKTASAAMFDTIKEQYQQDHNKILLAKNLSTFLRRVCISHYPRHDTAGLTGKDWLDFLDSTLPEKIQPRFADAGQILLTAPYLPEQTPSISTNEPLANNEAQHDFDAAALLELCEKWLQVQPVKTLRLTSGSSESQQTEGALQ